MITETREPHDWNAELWILVTKFDIVTLVSAEQPLKAPALITELSIVTEVKFVQRANANGPKLVIEFGIETSVSAVQPVNALPPRVTTASKLFMDARDVHPANAELPMLTTEAGSTKVGSEVQ